MLNSNTCLIFSEPGLFDSAAAPWIDDASVNTSATPGSTNLFGFIETSGKSLRSQEDGMCYFSVKSQ
jgi:hypothetical protein